MQSDASGRLHESVDGVLWDLARFELVDIQLTGASSPASPVFSTSCTSGEAVCWIPWVTTSRDFIESTTVC